MRILHVTSHMNVGGITSAVLSLAQAQAARGHMVFIASAGGELAPRIAEAGATHWRVPHDTSFEFGWQVWVGAWQLSRRLHRQPVDVIHAHTRVGQVVADRLARWHRTPFVATWHGFFRQNPGRRWWPCTGDVTIAISECVRQHLIADVRVPLERVALIYNGVDLSRFAEAPPEGAVDAFRARWQLPQHHPVVGMVGRMAGGGVKGFDLLLGAMQRARHELPELQLMLVGDGPRRAFLEQEVDRLGLREAVRFVGMMGDVRVPLAAMDVFAFSSRQQEGFGLSLVEAMAAGRPVVAFRTGAVPEIVRHDQDGWLVTPQDPAALAQGIVRLCRDRQLAARLGAQARRRVAETFTLDRMAGEVDAVYERARQEQACRR